MKRFTPQDDEIIRQMFHTHLLREIADRLNREMSSIFGRAKRLGLRLSDEEKQRRVHIGIKKGWKKGRATQYKPGHVPHNKCKKPTAETIEKLKPTWFPKGSTPHNYRPVGSVRKLKADGYLQIKLAKPKRWELLHRHVWRENYGEIPRGMIVVFKDRNPDNCEPENLELITRAENMKRNTIHNYPEEIVQALHTVGVLHRHIRKQGGMPPHRKTRGNAPLHNK